MITARLLTSHCGIVQFISKPLCKYCLLLVLVLAAALQASAQLSFSISPNPVYSEELYPGAEASAVITNHSTTTDTFLWQRQIIRLDHDSVCDLAVEDIFLHYLPLVSQSEFWLYPGQSGPLNVRLFDYNEIGYCALVHLKISKRGSPADTLTVVYHLQECQVVGTNDLAAAPKITVFPNPVQDVFSLKNARDVRALRLFDAQGKLVERFDATADHTYSLHHLPYGAYFIACEDVAGRVFQTLSVQKKM